MDIDHRLKMLQTSLDEERARGSDLSTQLAVKETELKSMKEARDGAVLKSQVTDDKM